MTREIFTIGCYLLLTGFAVYGWIALGRLERQMDDASKRQTAAIDKFRKAIERISARS